MATAKLWWNGSSWVTYSANWQSITSWQTGAYCWVRADFQIIAYDNATIGFSGTIWGDGSNSCVCNGTRTITAGGSTIATFSMSDTHSQSRTATISSPTATVAWSGSSRVTCWMNDGAYHSGQPWEPGSVSTTLSSPFRTITYNANNGTGAPSNQTVLTGIATNLSATVPTRSGWTFKGWATSDTATTATYAAGASITTSSNMTLYAVWWKDITISAPEGVTITFDGNDYTNQTASVSLAYGTYSLSMTAQSGWMIKTRSPDASVTQVVIANTGTTPANISTISATSQHTGLHLDNGTSWDQYMIYIDNGTSWDLYLAYIDDGTSWGQVY